MIPPHIDVSWSEAHQKLERRDYSGATAAYSAIIDMPNASLEWKAKALINRGNIKAVYLHQYADAVADFQSVFRLPGASQDLMQAAMENIDDVQKHLRNSPIGW